MRDDRASRARVLFDQGLSTLWIIPAASPSWAREKASACSARKAHAATKKAAPQTDNKSQVSLPSRSMAVPFKCPQRMSWAQVVIIQGWEGPSRLDNVSMRVPRISVRNSSSGARLRNISKMATKAKPPMNKITCRARRAEKTVQRTRAKTTRWPGHHKQGEENKDEIQVVIDRGAHQNAHGDERRQTEDQGHP